jgi:hypothetical protein
MRYDSMRVDLASEEEDACHMRRRIHVHYEV